jgi:hypothetical protein
MASPTNVEMTLREQAKRDKASKKSGFTSEEGDRARMDKSIVKAVLASPLTIPWYVPYNMLQDARILNNV